MSLTLVTPPTTPVVTDSIVAAYLRLDEPQFGVLDTLIAAATNYLDGPEGVLGRALVAQTWDYKTDCFPYPEWPRYNLNGGYVYPLDIPLSPVRTVLSVKYLDADGVEQTWSGANYVVDTGNNRIYTAVGFTYPQTRAVPNAVTVRFTAGPDEAAAADRLLVMFLTAHWYEHREPVVVGSTAAPLPEHLNDMINARRLWRVA